jgi:hypothetical protein
LRLGTGDRVPDLLFLEATLPFMSLVCAGVYAATTPGAPLHFMRAALERIHPKVAILTCACLPCMGWLWGLIPVAAWVDVCGPRYLAVVLLYPVALVGLNRVVDELTSR